jgi:hypothetical protein
MPPFREDDDEIVPESSGETDDKFPPQLDPDRIPQAEKAQETEPEGEQDDDPMGDDQPLVRQQARRPVKPVVGEEPEEEGQQADQGLCDDTTVPETEDEVPLATIVKAAKPAPKPLPQRGRSTRNKRPIVYTESPDTSEKEVSKTKRWFIFMDLKFVPGGGRNPHRTPSQEEEGRKG